MVKLTAELIQQSSQYSNALRDRELSLRGYKIPLVENLGATLDQFDAIDFSDNEIRKLDGFPLLRRLKLLLLNNNKIVRIGENLEQQMPRLEELILTNNTILELADIDPLASVKTLQRLSLMRNPLCAQKNYRLYVIHRLPQLVLLDFRKIKQKEREAANGLFQTKQGKLLEKEIQSKRTLTFTPGELLEEEKPTQSREEQQAIKVAIAKAKTLEEVERLNQILKSGQIPGLDLNKEGQGEGMEYEEDSD